MSKPVRRTFACPNGHRFEADVFRTANVTSEPHLKDTILAGRFNRLGCPICGQEIDADVPFLYHDMDAGYMVWVYPSKSADQADAIREKVRKSYEILGTVIPDQPDTPGRAVVFGVADLAAWLADTQST
jgi:hypothetical protein